MHRKLWLDSSVMSRYTFLSYRVSRKHLCYFCHQELSNHKLPPMPRPTLMQNLRECCQDNQQPKQDRGTRPQVIKHPGIECQVASHHCTCPPQSLRVLPTLWHRLLWTLRVMKVERLWSIWRARINPQLRAGEGTPSSPLQTLESPKDPVNAATSISSRWNGEGDVCEGNRAVEQWPVEEEAVPESWWKWLGNLEAQVSHRSTSQTRHRELATDSVKSLLPALRSFRRTTSQAEDSTSPKEEETMQRSLLMAQDKGKYKWGSQEPLSESGSNDHIVLLMAEQKLHGRASRACKDHGITSPRAWQRIYLQAREEAIASIRVRGPREPDEEDEGFEDHFMGTLTLLMSIQHGSQGTSLPTLPPKLPRRDSVRATT